ncbi:MAG: hypothetical protein RL757_601 [Bacteroidota bacterium]|jgi:hypothetical protein
MKKAIQILTPAAFAMLVFASCQNSGSNAGSVSSAAPTVATETSAMNAPPAATTETAVQTPANAAAPAPVAGAKPADVKSVTPGTAVASVSKNAPHTNMAPATPAVTAVPAQQSAPATSETTSIKWDEMAYNWGKLKQGEKMTHIFKFTNTGKKPLVILDAKGSCGCTVPEKPQAPIEPGKTGEIKVVFDSSGKEGGQVKTVTITANTDQPTMTLTIKGEVSKD